MCGPSHAQVRSLVMRLVAAYITAIANFRVYHQLHQLHWHIPPTCTCPLVQTAPLP